jgi:TetR/AcrR family transcriptional regulator, transcriptional repressor of bet genes
MTKARPVRAVESASERASRPRQRQRLIEACISALHVHGPSRTTVDKVVSIAEMSPGIVTFYFESKAAMLIAALQFLADEFEQQVLAPVAALATQPVAALESLVRLMLDPEIASPRKVSVWYAFWGEANSRQEYYDICGKKDAAFTATVQDLVARLVAEENNADIDADAIALGLIGVLEILWQEIAFQEEANIDRAGAERRALAYLRSVFPRRFAKPAARPSLVPSARLPGWAYADAALHAVERRRLFLPAWHCAGPADRLPRSGDYVALEIFGERALILRDPAGYLVARHNSCRRRPHALLPDGQGHLTGVLACPVDGMQYGLDGAGLQPIELALSGGLMFLRWQAGSQSAPALPMLPSPVASQSLEIAADWKTVLEQLMLEDETRRCVFPGLVVAETGPVWQIEPLAPGRSRLACFGTPAPLEETARLAASTQSGFASGLYAPDPAEQDPPAIVAFHSWLRGALPAGALER